MTDTRAILLERDVVAVSGADVVDYLQGQISQDLAGVPEGGSAWSLVLEPTGKVSSWFRLHRVGPQRFVLDLEADHGSAVVERLERFKLRTDVDIERVPGWRMLSIKGPDAGDVEVTAELTAAVTWRGFEGVDHLGPGVVPPPRVADMPPAEYEAIRIRAGWPALGAELTEQTIPGEVGAEFLDSSVSFTKGCFTGQELVARIDSRGGNVPWPIRILEIESEVAVPVGAEVVAAGSVAGRITSSAPGRAGGSGVALARLQRKVDQGSRVTVAGLGATVR